MEDVSGPGFSRLQSLLVNISTMGLNVAVTFSGVVNPAFEKAFPGSAVGRYIGKIWTITK